MKNVTIPTEFGPTPGRLEIQAASLPVIVLAHGAGAGMDHPWMQSMSTALIDKGFTVLAFNYRYTAEGRKAPDRLPKLLAVHDAVAQWATDELGPPILAGKSMGGRVGGHVAAEGEAEPVGLVYLGYPLVAMGKTEPRDTSHIERLATPQLFVSGTRDRMAPPDLLGRVVSNVPNGTLIAIETGDHSLKPLKSSGRFLDDTIAEAARAVQTWWSDQTAGGV